MSMLIQDVKYGLRQLGRNPGFTAIAVLTLALGIGANTAIFSVVNAVLLNPLPYSQPDRLVALYSRTSQFPNSSISYPNFLDWVRLNHSFSALAAYRQDSFTLTGVGEPERVPVELVSASFFPLLGIKPALGRWFTPQEDEIGAAPVVVLSGGLWKRKFGASPDVLGKVITLSGTSYTIVGILPANFFYSGNNFQRSDVYAPIGQWNDPTFRDRRASMGMDAVGRLKPGVALAQAKADMDVLGRRLAEQYPEADKGTGIALLPLKQNIVGGIQAYLLVLLAAVGFVLLIACVNVANLMLARATGRSREFAIRVALGAGRRRVIRQVLTESTLLAFAGGVLGTLVAAWGLQAALRALPDVLPRVETVQLDGRVLLFTLAACLLTGILFGLAPALRTSTQNLQQTLKEGGRGTSAAHHRTQSAFVVAEVALALVLLAGAGLMVRTLMALWSVDPGFDPGHVLGFRAAFPPVKSPDSIRAMWRQLQDKLEALPGIASASLTLGSMPTRSDSDLPFWLEGQPKPASNSQMKVSLFYLVQPDYLKVMKIPLVRGRFLNSTDTEHSPFVIVIDSNFARMYFHGQDPIGRQVHFDILDATAEIVGVVGHIKQWGLDENASSPVQAQCYMSVYQLPDQFIPLVASNLGFFVRTEGSPLAPADSIQRALHQINGHSVMYGVESMEGILSDSLSSRRFAMILMGVFAALALVMASIGTYGVISYLASQRTHEIGIRMALGAKRSDVLAMVVRKGVKLTLLGIGIGIAGSLVLTRFLSGMLYGVKPYDPLTLVLVSLVLMGVAFAACCIPARRASKVDPMVALRYE
ncbi:MAG: ABC transporter permease [Acidobacteria bacterium]|nr:MAG: ABC transporter permease [Acidobacteriota bacterium]